MLAGESSSSGMQVMLVANAYAVLLFSFGIGKGMTEIAARQSDEISRNTEQKIGGACMNVDGFQVLGPREPNML